MSDPTKRAAYEAPDTLLAPTPYDPQMRRPVTTITGAALLLLSSVLGILSVVGVLREWNLGLLTLGATLDDALDSAAGGDRTLLVTITVVLFVVDALFGVLVFAGLNWARVFVMVFSVVNTSSAFVIWLTRGAELQSQRSLYSLALDILILLALSSRSAAAYARRREQR